MQVEVYLYAHLRDRQPGSQLGSPLSFALPDGATGEDLLRLLGIGRDEAALFLVNGEHREPEVALADGDRVAVFPLVGGG